METVTITKVLTAAQVNALDNTIDQPIVSGVTGTIYKFKYAFITKLSGTAVGSATTATWNVVYTGETTALGTISNADITTVLGTGATAATYTCVNVEAIDGANPAMGDVLGKGLSLLGATGGGVASFDGTLQVTMVFDVLYLYI